MGHRRNKNKRSGAQPSFNERNAAGFRDVTTPWPYPPLPEFVFRTMENSLEEHSCDQPGYPIGYVAIHLLAERFDASTKYISGIRESSTPSFCSNPDRQGFHQDVSISRIREAEATFDSPSVKAMAEEFKKLGAVHYGWTTGTDKNPQANCAPQHGGSSGAYRDSAAPAANEGLTIPMSSDCQPCEKMHMRDWWSSQALYYILPNRVYFFLGAEEIDSEGECEWYMFLDLLFPQLSDRRDDGTAKSYFDEDVISREHLDSLTYHLNHKELTFCWKGMFLELWYPAPRPHTAVRRGRGGDLSADNRAHSQTLVCQVEGGGC